MAAKSKIPWTDEGKRELRRLKEQGLSYREIQQTPSFQNRTLAALQSMRQQIREGERADLGRQSVDEEFPGRPGTGVKRASEGSLEGSSKRSRRSSDHDYILSGDERASGAEFGSDSDGRESSGGEEEPDEEARLHNQSSHGDNDAAGSQSRDEHRRRIDNAATVPSHSLQHVHLASNASSPALAARPNPHLVQPSRPIERPTAKGPIVSGSEQILSAAQLPLSHSVVRPQKAPIGQQLGQRPSERGEPLRATPPSSQNMPTMVRPQSFKNTGLQREFQFSENSTLPSSTPANLPQASARELEAADNLVTTCQRQGQIQKPPLSTPGSSAGQQRGAELSRNPAIATSNGQRLGLASNGAGAMRTATSLPTGPARNGPGAASGLERRSVPDHPQTGQLRTEDGLYSPTIQPRNTEPANPGPPLSSGVTTLPRPEIRNLPGHSPSERVGAPGRGGRIQKQTNVVQSTAMSHHANAALAILGRRPSSKTHKDLRRTERQSEDPPLVQRDNTPSSGTGMHGAATQSQETDTAGGTAQIPQFIMTEEARLNGRHTQRRAAQAPRTQSLAQPYQQQGVTASGVQNHLTNQPAQRLGYTETRNGRLTANSGTGGSRELHQSNIGFPRTLNPHAWLEEVDRPLLPHGQHQNIPQMSRLRSQTNGTDLTRRELESLEQSMLASHDQNRSRVLNLYHQLDDQAIQECLLRHFHAEICENLRRADQDPSYLAFHGPELRRRWEEIARSTGGNIPRPQDPGRANGAEGADGKSKQND
ncbi:uncharacterized protein DSM5745_00759 [Aspergillus mulundensis]|uniref:Uncharacterized protein n=1 Tax=Aspergillus mulundensis TaxID=1810919 RepID=A0A3D8T4E9_9EURO|nr:hypothetical protein DSM5745_00759 [Aspergillus mulundensis]RDW93437.1 hypothetical protein DSM5745_00759 [Aspergillus mulundensis]